MNIDNRKRILLFSLLVLLLASLPIGIMLYERSQSTRAMDLEDGKTASEYYAELHTVYIDGEPYQPRTDLYTCLVYGLDTDGALKSSGSYNNSNQADFISLVIVNDTERSFAILHLNRDTMTQIPVLGITGAMAGTAYGQLALASTYGDGLESSAVNTVRAVSNLLFGLPINGYLSMTMDAVGIANDFFGGVTVTMPEDLTEIDPAFTDGATVTLMGDQALGFVRARMSVSDGTNLARMERQKLYLKGLRETLKDNSSEADLLVLFEQLSPYVMTNCADKISRMLDAFENYEFKGILSPAGSTAKGTEFIEFYVDEADLVRLCTENFFTKVDS